MSIQETLSLQGIELKRIFAREYAGACPKCGGEDRFRVFINENRYYCRGCSDSGDEIDFLQKYQGKTFEEACSILGKTEKLLPCKEKILKPVEPRKWQAIAKPEPGEGYQEAAKQFILSANTRLLNNPAALQWLKDERGISLETVKRFNLGWNDKDSFIQRKNWGLPVELKENGQEKKLFLPAGLVIPVERSGKIFRIKIRRSEIKPGEPRYLFISGGSQIPLIVQGGSVAMIIESELDAILLSQENAGASYIAMGSCSNRPDEETAKFLAESSGILVALDSDAAGAKACRWWKENYPESVAWVIPSKYGKDTSEAWKNNFPLSKWVNLGISQIQKTETDAIGRAMSVQNSENDIEHLPASSTLATGTLLDSSLQGREETREKTVEPDRTSQKTAEILPVEAKTERIGSDTFDEARDVFIQAFSSPVIRRISSTQFLQMKPGIDYKYFTQEGFSEWRAKI